MSKKLIISILLVLCVITVGFAQEPMQKTQMLQLAFFSPMQTVP